MKLPDERTAPNTDPLAYSIYLYGEPKTGKTTWAAQQADALFLATEPGLEALDVCQLQMNSWQDLRAAVVLLEKSPDKYAAVVVDTIDLAYELCAKHYTRKHKIDHVADREFGKGHGIVKDMFSSWLASLCRLPMQVILIGHAKFRPASKYAPAKHIPACATGAAAAITGLVDCTLFVEAAAKASVVHCLPGATWMAGCRVSGMPAKLKMDYHTFMAALAEAVTRQTGKATPPPANTEGELGEPQDDTDDDPFA